MKGFFKIMFATIVGFVVTIVLFILIMAGIVSAMVSSGDKAVTISRNSILKLDFNNEISERSPNNPFSDLNIPGLSRNKQDGLTEIIANIKKAQDDKNIKGVFLDLSTIPARIATIEEIRNVLLDFKKSGKFIISYADYYSQSAYYLASVSDKIYLNPQGSIDFVGIRSEIMFYKGALEKLGLEPEIIRHGKFKSAVEPFMTDKMSDENRLQVSKFIKSIWEHSLKGISEQRKLSIAELNRLANTMVLADADSCLSSKMVDSLFYKDQLNAQLLKLSGQKSKEPEFISLSKYEKVVKLSTGKGFAKNKIAVIYAQGDVKMGDDDEGTVSSDRISQALRDARTDTSVKAIVFRINSPGGSALASDVIWREVKLASKVKPVIASMGALAASGGYYIACAADTIVAEPNTITGSIGVFSVLFNAQKLLNQKFGITTDVAKTNIHSDFPSISRPMDAQEKAFLQMEIDKMYGTFISHVSEGRKIDKQKIDDIGQGRVWTGQDAKEIGLVDVLGGLTDAIDIAAKMAKLKNYRVVNLPVLEEPFEKFIKDLTGEVKLGIIKSELGAEYKYYNEYKNLLNMKGVQARLPFSIEVY